MDVIWCETSERFILNWETKKMIKFQQMIVYWFLVVQSFTIGGQKNFFRVIWVKGAVCCNIPSKPKKNHLLSITEESSSFHQLKSSTGQTIKETELGIRGMMTLKPPWSHLNKIQFQVPILFQFCKRTKHTISPFF